MQHQRTAELTDYQNDNCYIIQLILFLVFTRLNLD